MREEWLCDQTGHVRTRLEGRVVPNRHTCLHTRPQMHKAQQQHVDQAENVDASFATHLSIVTFRIGMLGGKRLKNADHALSAKCNPIQHDVGGRSACAPRVHMRVRMVRSPPYRAKKILGIPFRCSPKQSKELHTRENRL